MRPRRRKQLQTLAASCVNKASATASVTASVGVVGQPRVCRSRWPAKGSTQWCRHESGEGSEGVHSQPTVRRLDDDGQPRVRKSRLSAEGSIHAGQQNARVLVAGSCCGSAKRKSGILCTPLVQKDEGLVAREGVLWVGKRKGKACRRQGCGGGGGLVLCFGVEGLGV